MSLLRCLPLLFLGALPLAAADSGSAWTRHEGVLAPNSPRGARQGVRADKFIAFQIDQTLLRAQLAAAPEEMRRLPASPLVLVLPRPDGKFERFSVERTALLAPELAAKFPHFLTLTGRGLDDPAASVRVSWTELGFHAQILRPGGGWCIDPCYVGETGLVLVYARRDAARSAQPKSATQVPPPASTPGAAARPLASAEPESTTGATRRTYRLAVACTGEYSAYFGGTAGAALSAVVAAVNRVTGIFENETTIRFQLVANNSALIYLNPATDPYTNFDLDLMRSQNQSNLDVVIGEANYDVGHVFATGDGGTSVQGSACASGLKARGVTGTFDPVGDPFYIDYVTREFARQFDATNTFDSVSGFCAGLRNGPSAFEPGGGSTIMGSAGLCDADDLQSLTDPYFHGASIDAILRYVTQTGGSACPALSASGNQPPTVVLPANATIPNGTPFALTASGSDPDGDPLTYAWEQFDADVMSAGHALTDPDNGLLPLFRSFAPVASGTRHFPRLADILSGTPSPGERLPSYTGAATRPLTFRCTVRDGRGGVLTSNSVVLTVATAAGPFVVTAPGSGASWTAGSNQTVTWNVAGTTANGINTASVNILLSRDNGATFPITLAAGVPNNGSASFLVPFVAATTTARVTIQPVGNVYLAISRPAFSITAAADTDTDGLPDAYELANGLNPNNPADAALDADGDGQSNLSEFLAGTNPRDPADVLRIVSEVRDTGGVTVSFPTKLNVTYRLERSADLTGTWTPILSNVAGNGANVNVTDPAGAGGPKFFYRVRTVAP